MSPKDFVLKYYADAKKSEEHNGISALFNLAEAAEESAWGEHAPGNAFFGIKDHTGDNSKRQLLITHEIHSDANHKYPEILSIDPITIKGKPMYNYKVKDWFRKYDSPSECFMDHANFFYANSRYANALKVKSDPYAFADEIAQAGYATNPNYASNLHKLIKMIEPLIPKQ